MNAYGQHRAKVLSEFETIDGYVKCCELGYPTEVLPNGKLRAGNDLTDCYWYSLIELDLGELRGELRRGRLVLTPNKFPYDLAQGIEHYILWRVGCSDDDDGGVQLSPETIARYIDEESGLKANSQQIRYFFMPQALKSMPEIPHCHLVVLLKWMLIF